MNPIFKLIVVLMFSLLFHPLLVFGGNPPFPKAVSLDEFADRYLNDCYHRHPGAASMDGIHEYDTELDSMSSEAIASEVGSLKSFQKELDQFDVSLISKAEQKIDYQLLENSIKARLLNLETIRLWERSPLIYSDLISNSLLSLLLFPYAPDEVRLRSIIAREKQVHRLLLEARGNLKHIPQVFAERLGHEFFDGTLKFIEQDIPQAFKEVQNTSLMEEFKAATVESASEVRSFMEELPKMASASSGDFALGTETFSLRLRLEEGIETPLNQLLELAKKEIERSRNEFKTLALAISPQKTPEQVWKDIREDHPAEGKLIEETKKGLQTLIDFIKEKQIITIPPASPPLILQTPKFLSSNTFATVYSPGVFEKTPLTAVYYATDVEPDWTAEEKNQHLREFARPLLWTVNIHEAYPGHYIQGVRMRQAPSKIRMAGPMGSYAFQEGWAHYCEQMIIEEGFQKQDPTIRIGLLKDALLRLCRCYVGIALHTKQMTIEEGTAFFQENDYMDKVTASEETLRGTYDPMYILYSIGKMALFKLRADYKSVKGSTFTLKEFHDRLLSQGNAPIWVLRRVMLPEDKWNQMLGN
ncbi:MAG: DUF885 domain-containing protein [Candidatus Riflebacteria bacterium]|nr:DUF885 domain-containing protein [Candidatus Riflebacteria bacterium]